MNINNIIGRVTRSAGKTSAATNNFPITPKAINNNALQQDTFIKSPQFAGIEGKDPIKLNKPETETTEITRDGFTGLRDKRCLMKRLDEKIQKAAENGDTLSVAMFDMDNFKSVNELLSYEIGDDFIQEIGKSVQSVARKNKVGSYRFGGEEFIMILTGKEREEIEDICSKVQNKITTNPLITHFSDVYVQKAKDVISECMDTQVYMDKIYSTKIRIEVLKDLINKDFSLVDNPTVHGQLKMNEEELENLYRSAVKVSAKTEKNEKVKENLKVAYDILTNGTPKEKSNVIYSTHLNDYINARYEKTAQIAHTRNWLRDHEQNCGFTITCGVVDMSPEFLKQANAKDVIDLAGEILKEGKHIQKGDIYYKKIDN